jgi:cell division protease FtsH
MAQEIDLEIKRFVTENYERTKHVLTEQMASLRALAEALFEKEVLDALDIEQILMQPSAQAVPV